MTKASTIMRWTLMPMTAAALRLKATAVSALPSTARLRKTWTRSTVPVAATMMKSSWGKMPAGPTRRTASPKGEGNLICSGPQICTAAFFRMMLMATVLSTQDSDRACRSTGRMATRSSPTPMSPTRTTAPATATP